MMADLAVDQVKTLKVLEQAVLVIHLQQHLLKEETEEIQDLFLLQKEVLGEEVQVQREVKELLLFLIILVLQVVQVLQVVLQVPQLQEQAVVLLVETVQAQSQQEAQLAQVVAVQVVVQLLELVIKDVQLQ